MACWLLILKARRNQKQQTLCQEGGYKSSFTISAFPFPRVIFDGQHYLFCHRGAVLRAGKCIFMVLWGSWNEQLANPKARADSNTSPMRCREHYRQGYVTPACCKIQFPHSADTGRGPQASPGKGLEYCIKAFILAKKTPNKPAIFMHVSEFQACLSRLQLRTWTAPRHQKLHQSQHNPPWHLRVLPF